MPKKMIRDGKTAFSSCGMLLVSRVRGSLKNSAPSITSSALSRLFWPHFRRRVPGAVSKASEASSSKTLDAANGTPTIELGRSGARRAKLRP